MAQALSAGGKKVTVVKLAGEDHWLSRTDTRVQLLKAVEKFLHANL
jgi:dipeptidyl aminopeptidase/acylaminoacyl peptidase